MVLEKLSFELLTGGHTFVRMDICWVLQCKFFGSKYPIRRLNTNGRTDNGQKVITIALLEHSSGDQMKKNVNFNCRVDSFS